MKVAFLHVEPQPGNIEANRKLIEHLILAAADRNAQWILTPELCISGYYFADAIGTAWIKPQPDEWMWRIMTISRERGLVIFLSHPERDEKTGKMHNMLFAIGKGEIVGRHRKIEVHPGAEEAWSSPGDSTEPETVDGVKVGMLICADTWGTHHGMSLSGKKAGLLVVSVAWGHKYSPLEQWKKLSLETRLPVWVCNRTGIERNVDWTKAESIVLKDGEPLFSYFGQPALLLFDWDMKRLVPESTGFEIIPIETLEGG